MTHKIMCVIAEKEERKKKCTENCQYEHVGDLYTLVKHESTQFESISSCTNTLVAAKTD